MRVDDGESLAKRTDGAKENAKFNVFAGLEVRDCLAPATHTSRDPRLCPPAGLAFGTDFGTQGSWIENRFNMSFITNILTSRKY